MNFTEALKTILLQPHTGKFPSAKKEALRILNNEIDSDGELCVAILTIQGLLGNWTGGTAKEVRRALSEFQGSITARAA